MGKLFTKQILIDLVKQSLHHLTGWRRHLSKVLKVTFAVSMDILSGRLAMRAMSLVYTTLLSIVPLLALSFSVLKALGAHHRIEPLLFNFLEPLGEQGKEIGLKTLEFVENTKVGVLGSLGLVLLIYTVISLVQKIERSFNFIWMVPEGRRLLERFSNYLSVILIGPVLVVSAIGITASIMSSTVVQTIVSLEPFGTLMIYFGRVVPYFLIVATFTFVYIFVPNTKVKLSSALIGGLIAGVLWQTVGVLFASFVVTSTKYAAIYSSFAIMILLLIWLYLSWLILLIGSDIAFYVQYPEKALLSRKPIVLSNRMRHWIGFSMIYLISAHHRDGRENWTVENIAHRLEVSQEAVGDLLKSFKDSRILTELNADPIQLIPATDIANISMQAVYRCIDESGEITHAELQTMHMPDKVGALLTELNQDISMTLGNKSLKDWI